MEPKLNVVNRHDALDIEAFKQMVESDPFQKIQARIKAELLRATEACTRSDGQLEVNRGQGAVAALQAVLRLPAQVLAEMMNPPH